MCLFKKGVVTLNQKKKNRLEIKDLISIGVYTAMYFFMIILSNLFIIFLVPGYSYIFIPIMAAFLSGITYMLMVAKVQKFGAITIMGSIVGGFQFMMGLYPWSIVFGIGVALLADIIAYSFKYKSEKGLLISYAVFSYSTIGPILPMFLFPNLYVNYLASQGRDAVYIENAFASITQYTILIVIFGILIASILGGVIGQKMLKKHFKRAGII